MHGASLARDALLCSDICVHDAEAHSGGVQPVPRTCYPKYSVFEYPSSRPVDSPRNPSRFRRLGVIFSAHCGRHLWVPGLDRARLFRPVALAPLPRRNAGQSDAGLRVPARLGSPLALQRRAHPGDSGWIPARFGRLVHPRLYFRNYARTLARSSNDRRRD
jgi:hypothetical protein